jgi:methylmalonyl-CoA mutase
LEKKLGELPLVQILGFGSLAKYSARLEFAQTFLEPCGFALDQQIGIDSINQALKIVQKTMPAVVTVCSDNDSYPELIPELAKRLKRELPKSILVVAGYLESHAEEFKASGVDCFFELRTNHLEFLEGLHQKVEGL